jgi:hypothetical protein
MDVRISHSQGNQAHRPAQAFMRELPRDLESTGGWSHKCDISSALHKSWKADNAF